MASSTSVLNPFKSHNPLHLLNDCVYSISVPDGFFLVFFDSFFFSLVILPQLFVITTRYKFKNEII